MKKLIVLGMYGLIVFAVSGASAWFFHSKAVEEANAVPEEPKPTSVTPQKAVSPDILTARTPDDVVPDQESPVAVRPKSMSVEEIVRLGLSLKSREQGLKDREIAFRRIESRHQLVLADIEAEQKEIQGLVAQAQDQRATTVEILKEVRQRQLEMEKQSQAAASAESQKKPAPADGPSESDKTANLKDLTEVVQSMTPENAASVMKEFANNGKTDMAVQILSKLEERKAASILDSMKDEKLVSEFLEKFVSLKRPEKPKARR